MRAVWFSLLLVALAIDGNAIERSNESATTPDQSNFGPKVSSVCDRNLGSGAPGAWFTKLVHSLCRKGDSDSLLAAYLVSLPSFTHGEPDARLLGRAYEIGKSNTKTLWTVVIDENCEPVPECVGNQRAINAARTLTRVDPENAMSWFALAYTESQFGANPEETSRALIEAAKAPRFHDYTFDLLKLAMTATGGVPIPAEVSKELGGGGAFPNEQIRFDLAATTSLMGSSFASWLKRDCEGENSQQPERIGVCKEAKKQLTHGDSMLTLSRDTAAVATIQANIQSSGNPSGEFAKAIIDSIHESHSERELFAKAAARLARK